MASWKKPTMTIPGLTRDSNQQQIPSVRRNNRRHDTSKNADPDIQTPTW